MEAPVAVGPPPAPNAARSRGLRQDFEAMVAVVLKTLGASDEGDLVQEVSSFVGGLDGRQRSGEISVATTLCFFGCM